MEKEVPFEVAVIDDESYENLVAEVRFPSKEFGLILSQEESRERIDVSIFFRSYQTAEKNSTKQKTRRRYVSN
jgi:hypothetical protein